MTLNQIPEWVRRWEPALLLVAALTLVVMMAAEVALANYWVPRWAINAGMVVWTLLFMSWAVRGGLPPRIRA